MRLRIIVALALILFGGLLQAATKSIYRQFRVSQSEIGIVCLNGGDPTIEPHSVTNVAIISCGDN